MYKPISENPIVIDFSKVRYYDELYELLKQKFGLPDYTGHNLDALWNYICASGGIQTSGLPLNSTAYSPSARTCNRIWRAYWISSAMYKKRPGVTFLIKS
ncbi:MAG: barstar family protein [Clostridia bacterium]|nr:barstar family protein [Clostridia bacterium]